MARTLRLKTLPPNCTVAQPKFTGSKPAMFALGRKKNGEMNQTEEAYAMELNLRVQHGEVVWWAFESVKLRLADNTYYIPDFAVMLASGQMEMHEVKGFMMEDANVKIKVAAEVYPFVFRLIRKRAKKTGGGWDITEV